MPTSLAGYPPDSSRPSNAEVEEGWRDADKQLIEFGGAKPGDKTMINAMHPFVKAFTCCEESLTNTWSHAAEGARQWALRRQPICFQEGSCESPWRQGSGYSRPRSGLIRYDCPAVSPVLNDSASEEQCNAGKVVLS